MSRKLTRVLGAVALVGALSLGGTAIDSQPAEGLKLFWGFNYDCQGQCPEDPWDGQCCAVAPPIIVEG